MIPTRRSEVGDNYRRARAWPEREGHCPDCGRWARLATARGVRPATTIRHKCRDGGMRAVVADDVYEPKATGFDPSGAS